MKAPPSRWTWAKDRLASAPGWRLWWALVMPLGFSALFLVLSVRSGQTAFVVLFAVLLGASVLVVGAASTLKVRRRGEPARAGLRE